jgi:hypothetical protein
VRPFENKTDLTALESIFFGAHIGSEYGGASMPLTGPIQKGGTFFCPHCGALYSVTHSRLSESDRNIANVSSACKSWTSGIQPRFRSISSFSDLKMPKPQPRHFIVCGAIHFSTLKRGRPQEAASALLRIHADWQISARMSDAPLGLSLSRGFGLRWKLEDRCLLTLT